jgi:anti-anti-sigma regulatory factor
MILVEFRDGQSNFDNGRKKSDAQVKPPVPTSGSLNYGELGESTVINICGRGTYMLSYNFFDAVQAIIDGKRGLTIDLSECDYLDSTFLGMIHEVVAKGDKAGVPVHVQRINENVRRLFEELSMDLVLQHVHEPAEPLPYMEPLVKTALDEGTLHRRILRAHDVLVSLSDENPVMRTGKSSRVWSTCSGRRWARQLLRPWEEARAPDLIVSRIFDNEWRVKQAQIEDFKE